MKDISSTEILAIAPPGEVGNQLLENMPKESCITNATISRLVDLIDEEGRPRMHRWINIAEAPFIGGQLSVGVHVPLAQEQDELLLGKGWVNQCQWDAVESQIP